MTRLTVEDLKIIKEKYRAAFALREGGYRAKVTVHMGTCGLAAGAREVMNALIEELANLNLTDIIATTSGCAGLCSREPMATVEVLNEAPVKYCNLNGEKMKEILKEHVLGGRIVDGYALVIGSETAY